MALANYTDLRAALGTWNFNRTDLPTADLVLLAETRINSDLRVRQMQGRSTSTISDEYSTVPTDMLEVISFRVGDEQLSPVAAAQIDAEAATTGQPLYYAIVGTEFRFSPAPDTSYTGTLTYWKKLPDLATNETNWLLTNWPDVYLWAGNLEVALWLQDRAAAETAEARYQAALRNLRAQDAKNRTVPLRCEAPLVSVGTFNINTGRF